MRRSSTKEIIGYQDNQGIWRIAIDGVQHTADFVSDKDIREFVRNLQANGLYTEYRLFF